MSMDTENKIEITKEGMTEALKTVLDPELKMDIVTLGLIYDMKSGEDGIDILMTLTTPFCPYGDEIIQMVEKVLAKKFGVVSVIRISMPSSPLFMS